jgi:hypothetical protein
MPVGEKTTARYEEAPYGMLVEEKIAIRNKVEARCTPFAHRGA